MPQWRDCQAWKDEGLPLSTTSNEAAKLYDACLTQLFGFYDEPEFGGLANTMTQMNLADPKFCQALVMTVSVMGALETINSNLEIERMYNSLKNVFKESENKNFLSTREHLHLKAALLIAEGKVREAAKILEDILLDYPTDPQAFRIAFYCYFFLGNLTQLRDCVPRVLPYWEKKDHPIKSYLYGYYAYGLEETHEYGKAKKYAKMALDENMRDGFATHSLAHVFEMEGHTTEGLKFMNDTVQNWEHSNLIAGRNHWHRSLFHLENEDFESAVTILETELLSRACDAIKNSNINAFDIVDSPSLLYRLHILNPTSLKPTHWETATQICKPFHMNHNSTFNDVHLMMAFAGSKNQKKSIEELMESLPQNNGGDFNNHPGVTKPLLQSISDFVDEKYEKVVDELSPMRYDIERIGGSYAQRDIFNLILIVASMKSSNLKHKKLAVSLVNEREALKSTPLSKRLTAMANSFI